MTMTKHEAREIADDLLQGGDAMDERLQDVSGCRQALQTLCDAGRPDIVGAVYALFPFLRDQASLYTRAQSYLARKFGYRTITVNPEGKEPGFYISCDRGRDVAKIAYMAFPRYGDPFLVDVTGDSDEILAHFPD